MSLKSRAFQSTPPLVLGIRLAVLVVTMTFGGACDGCDAANTGDMDGGADASLDAAEPICTPGTLRCVGEATVEVCSADGLAYVPSTTCEGATPVCLAGACVACSEGETTCADGASTHTCLADGSFGAPTTCDAATPACLDGTCVVCAPGTSACSDAGSTQTCLPDGTYGEVVMCDVTTPACHEGACVVCTPGSWICADDGHTQTCLADGSGYDTSVACEGATPACHEGACVTCLPGSTICDGDAAFVTCAPDGSAFAAPTACADVEACSEGACVPLCTLAEASPSSLGCSFLGARLDNFQSAATDAIVVVNPDAASSVEAQLYFVADDTNIEEAVGEPVTLAAHTSHAFTLTHPAIESVSLLRRGGVYRVQTTKPIAAFHHSSAVASSANDAMLLLPDHVLTGHYVVASYPGTVGQYPSYFTAVGIVDGTNFAYTPPQATAGGTGVTALAAGETGMLTLNRFDLLNVVVTTQMGGDLAGTIIDADQPVWLAGATECANVPGSTVLYCDFLSELMIPLENWGTEYVAAHAPTRGPADTYHWRVYAGADDVTIDALPAQPGFPVTLDKGAYLQVATTQSFVLTGDGPFMPVQYLQGASASGSGDPSMTLGVPTAQYTDAYAFATSSGYANYYAQVIRPVGGADVTKTFFGYVALGDYEVVDVPIVEGAHFAESVEPFGLSIFAYSNVSSFACPAGLALRTINPM